MSVKNPQNLTQKDSGKNKIVVKLGDFLTTSI